MKHGKFVARECLILSLTEIELFKSYIQELFSDDKFKGHLSWALEWSDRQYANTACTYTLKLDNPIGKLADVHSKGSFVHDISNLYIKLVKSHGYDEVTKEELEQYELWLRTDGKYHRYKSPYRCDCTFEGKGHFNYDDDLRDLKKDLAQWKYNIERGMAI